MSAVDLVIVLAFILGMLLGAHQGFITPALTTIGFVSIPLLLLSQPQLRRWFEGPSVLVVVVAPFLVAVVAAVLGVRIARAVHRHRTLGSVDRGLGAVLYLVVVALVTYIAIGFLIALDIGLAPIHRLTALGPGDVARLEASLSSNPIAPIFVDPRSLTRLEADARARPVPIGELGQYDRALGWYELMIRPQLTTSRLAPLMVAVGSEIQLGAQVVPMPQELPRDQAPSSD